MRTAYEKGRVVYEPSQHDDDVTPDNIVRSQFGSPPAGGNGNGTKPEREPRSGMEPYRFDPNRPRRRRYAGPEPTVDQSADDDATEAEGRQSAAEAISPKSTQWTVKRPDHLKRNNSSGDAEETSHRLTRAERRRAHAEEPPVPPQGEQYAATRSADLTRIASFLRSTQDPPGNEVAALTGASDSPGRGRHHAGDNQDKTSELPTVPTEPNSAQQTTNTPSDAVLAAVREVPGVTGARLTESDSKLALDISDDADADAVHRTVIEVLDAHLGLQAQPVSPAVGTVETEPHRDRQLTGMSGGATSRAVLERIQVITSGFESIVEVGLAVNGIRAVGRSTGPAVDWHVLRGAADATVDAIGVLLGKSARVVVEHAGVEPAGSLRVAVVVVLLLTEAGAEQLAGAAPVTGDRRQAVVHATLQALNRRLEAMLVT